MNKDKDLTELLAGCATQVLHHTDRIQPFGILIRSDYEGTITHISANAGTFFEECRPEECLGGKISLFFDNNTTENILTEDFKYTEIRTSAGRAEVVSVKYADGILIEICPYAGDSAAASEAEYALLKYEGDDLSLDFYLQELTKAVRTVTDFDKVTVYRFLDDWSGEVVAEAGNGRLPSYSGLHFPASDIPEPARNLYLKHPWRLIANVDADPVPVLSHTVPAALDLTKCDLRAAAPVHLEYLRNMGVKASFSVSITVQGKLWGLIACHHTEPRTLSYHARRLTHFISRSFVMRLLAVQAKERMKLADSIDHAMEELTRRLVTAGKDELDINEIKDSLKELVQADYTVFISDHGIQKFDCPFSNDELLFIDEWYMGMNEDLLFTDQIHYMIPWLKIPPENCSGLLAVRTPYRHEDGSNKWLRFYWIRKEFPHHVNWAGEPVKEESVDSETGVPYLSPRRSFAEWKELKRGFSRPWSIADLLTARKFRGSLLHWLRTR